METPGPEKEDLIGEIQKLRRKVKELEIKIELVEAIGLTIDIQHKCCRWRHGVKFSQPYQTK